MQVEISKANPIDCAKQAGAEPSPRLVKAAHEFEGLMMKELLKPMTDGGALTDAEDEADPGGDSGGVLGAFATEALGQALSVHGGLGIADRILKTLSGSSQLCE
jgi:Rod binding domain-containing protein